MRYIIDDARYHFRSAFDTETGAYVRTGILDENGKDTGVDPFMASYPHLIDVGVMGHCIHGKTGLCAKAGIGCYQSGLTVEQPNMAVEDFRWIAEQSKHRCNQLALGGRGDPDQHEHFEELLKICRENDLVPNFTTSGYGMTPEIAALCKQYCGAVAVSWYRSEYTLSAIRMNVSRDVLFGVGYSANTSVLPGTYANGSVYSFLLVVTDGIETASATCVVDRAFANLHLSGQSTGGVAIGKFSAATYGNPLFECEFPAVFGGGINKGAVEIVNITTINSNFKLYRTGEYPRIIRFGNVVFLEGCLSPSKSLTMSSTSNQYTMITIPTGYRPSREMIFVCHGSTLCLWLLRINTSGECIFERYRKGDAYATPASGNWLPFSAVWILPE